VGGAEGRKPTSSQYSVRTPGRKKIPHILRLLLDKKKGRIEERKRRGVEETTCRSSLFLKRIKNQDPKKRERDKKGTAQSMPMEMTHDSYLKPENGKMGIHVPLRRAEKSIFILRKMKKREMSLSLQTGGNKKKRDNQLKKRGGKEKQPCAIASPLIEKD